MRRDEAQLGELRLDAQNRRDNSRARGSDMPWVMVGARG